MINIVNRTSHEDNISSADSAKMRFWSPDFILNEFEKLYEFGVRTLRITDEMFFLNRKYYVPILEGLIERGLKFNLWAYARVDTVRDKLIDKLKKAGFNWLAFGIEAADENVREDVQKGFGQDDILSTINKSKPPELILELTTFLVCPKIQLKLCSQP